MFWNRKKTIPVSWERELDQAYVNGAREERRQVIEIMDRIIDENDGIEIWSCSLRQAMAEIKARGYL